MAQASYRDGKLVPLGSWPAEWPEGVLLDIQLAQNSTIDIDEWAELMNQICSDSESVEDSKMFLAISEARDLAKLQSRREMGLTE